MTNLGVQVLLASSAQVQLLDVASQASVRAFARRWTDARRPLHVLVNNAGVFCFGGGGWVQQDSMMQPTASKRYLACV